MARGEPGRAVRWLIAGLRERGVHVTPSKIERLQASGLAPRPRRPRRENEDAAGLWPPGALEHYCAVIPLLCQRHEAVHLAALTMLGWGYPVELETARSAYNALFTFDPEDAAERFTERYREHGMPMLASMVRHLRRHGDGCMSADEIVHALLTRATGVMTSGVASVETVRSVLPAIGAPDLVALPEDVLDQIASAFSCVVAQMSIRHLVDTAMAASVEDLVAVQPQAARLVDTQFNAFGGFVEGCAKCNETHGFMVAAMMPAVLRLKDLGLTTTT